MVLDPISYGSAHKRLQYLVFVRKSITAVSGVMAIVYSSLMKLLLIKTTILRFFSLIHTKNNKIYCTKNNYLAAILDFNSVMKITILLRSI